MGCNRTVETINVIKVKPKSKISNLILKVPIAFKDRGYKDIKTKIFTKKGSLDEFIKRVKSQKKWDKKRNFLEIIDKLKVDFDKDNLLLYIFKANSDISLTAVDTPISEYGHIFIKIGKEITKEFKKDNKTLYYGLLYKVKKEALDITFDDGNRKSVIKNRF
jgi:hypothetical protein